MNEKKKQENSLSAADLVVEAWKQAENKDLLTVKIRKGDNFPLLSDWEVGDLVYRVVVVGIGYVELARVMR